MADPLSGLHDQGPWFSSFVLPSSQPTLPTLQLLTSGFFGCLRVWASRAWVNAATHLFKPPCSEFTVTLYWQPQLAAASSPTSTSSPTLPPASCGLGSWRTIDALYCAHLSVLCCSDGIPQVTSVLLQLRCASVCTWNTLHFGLSTTPETILPFEFTSWDLVNLANVTLTISALLAQMWITGMWLYCC